MNLLNKINIKTFKNQIAQTHGDGPRVDETALFAMALLLIHAALPSCVREQKKMES